MSKLAISHRNLSKMLFISSFLSLILVSNRAIAESELLKTLTVTGNATETIPTSLAEVSLGVEINGETPTRVQQEVSRRTSAVINMLRSKDVEQLQTTGVRLSPKYEQSSETNSQRILVGYTGTNTLSFRIPTEKLGALLEEAVEAGATRIDRVSFTATQRAIFDTNKEALRKASINARDRADVVLSTLNLSSNEIINIEVDNASIDRPNYLDIQYSRGEAISTAPIVSGEQTIKASVTLQISY